MTLTSIHDTNATDLGDDGLSILSDAERAEVKRLQSSPNIAAIEVVDKNGEPLLECDAWPGISTIFSNVVDSASNIAKHLGEEDSLPIVMMRGAKYDVSGISMVNANVVVVYERSKKIAGRF
ncbi:cytochrome b involved in lipid metabolism [Rubricella aquisinus]|uniref:Cytochrome b involved in lipid metabolism n=1 Tax=Rubricella aquisinus TaxID=2028108 RepID=A0A840WJP0_9RHOB|nr:hypothetical protein [Rubricella aquisinus]MBB5514741.1 cytochrome b involved in lipid metabolism [Rubricella aquisinus]